MVEVDARALTATTIAPADAVGWCPQPARHTALRGPTGTVDPYTRHSSVACSIDGPLDPEEAAAALVDGLPPADDLVEVGPWRLWTDRNRITGFREV